MTIQERDENFNLEVLEIGNKAGYQYSMLVEFLEYWTEQNKSGTKLKFELEKTWQTGKRLKRWFNNQKKWNGATKMGTSEARVNALKRW